MLCGGGEVSLSHLGSSYPILYPTASGCEAMGDECVNEIKLLNESNQNQIKLYSESFFCPYPCMSLPQKHSNYFLITAGIPMGAGMPRVCCGLGVKRFLHFFLKLLTVDFLVSNNLLNFASPKRRERWKKTHSRKSTTRLLTTW